MFFGTSPYEMETNAAYLFQNPFGDPGKRHLVNWNGLKN
jgi:hypothetical protein